MDRSSEGMESRHTSNSALSRGHCVLPERPLPSNPGRKSSRGFLVAFVLGGEGGEPRGEVGREKSRPLLRPSSTNEPSSEHRQPILARPPPTNKGLDGAQAGDDRFCPRVFFFKA